MNALPAATFVLGAHVFYTAVRAVVTGRSARAHLNLAALPDPPRVAGVSVLIPAWNDASTLEDTLTACLRDVGATAAPTQLIVIAGGSDGSYDRAVALTHGLDHEGLSVLVLPQTPNGKNAALNAGLRAATHDLLVFLDADTVVRPGWLAALVGPLQAGRAGATTGHFRASCQTPVSRIFELQQFVGQRLRGPVHLFGGGSIALHRRTLDLIGGALPEEVLVGVDFDLTERLRQAGQVLMYCEAAAVQTEISSTWAEYWRGERRWQRAHLAAQRRHVRDLSLRRMVGLLYVPGVYAALLGGWLVGPLLTGLLVRSPLLGFQLWLGFACWVLGRHAATCLEAAAASGDTGWLKLLPTSMTAFCLSAAATWVALSDSRPVSAHFKGRRTGGLAR